MRVLASRAKARPIDDAPGAAAFGLWTTAVTALALGMLALGMLAPAATAQTAATGSRDTVRAFAGQLLAAGRGNEARILLQSAARGSRTPDDRISYRLAVADAYLYDGDYTRALGVYDAVLARAGERISDSLTSRLHHGMALAEAFAGHSTQAATHYSKALAARAAITDSIEMLIVTGQHEVATAALDRAAAQATTAGAQQFVAAYRAFNAMEAGHCTVALASLAVAPHPDRPVPLAVRGRCAAKHGERPSALALRDSVLKAHVPNPFAWPNIIARDVARRIR